MVCRDPALPGLESRGLTGLFLWVVHWRKLMTTWAPDITFIINKILCIIRKLFPSFIKLLFNFFSRRIFLCSSNDWGARTLIVGRTTYKQVLG